MKSKRSPSAYEDMFLPNFCGMRMVFVTVVIAQLFAFLLVLMPLEETASDRWRNLSLISMFVQWIALSSCALLCLLRPYLCRLSNTQVAAISYILMLAVIALVSEVTYWLIHNIDISYGVDWHIRFLVRNMSIGAIISALLLRYFYVQHQWARNIKSKSEARLQALQSRIRPHFLFNSMNTIACLIRDQPEQAETAIEDLADLFRVSLKDIRDYISLAEELELCRRYLHIESLRLGERLNIEWQIDPLPEDALIPPLIVQPLVENAIYHGIELLTEGGTVSIIGTRHNRKLAVVISNPIAVEKGVTKAKGNRLALDNIRERLDAYYGSQQRVEIQQDKSQYQVAIHFPYLNDEDEDPYR